MSANQQLKQATTVNEVANLSSQCASIQPPVPLVEIEPRSSQRLGLFEDTCHVVLVRRSNLASQRVDPALFIYIKSVSSPNLSVRRRQKKFDQLTRQFAVSDVKKRG
jgi:hypothetical protein